MAERPASGAAPGVARAGAQDAWRLEHHAMRQPLSALGLYCEALKMQALGAAQQPLVDGIADAAVALERLVDAHFAALSDLPVGSVAAAVPVAAPPAVPFPSLSPLASRLPAPLPAPLPSPSPSALDADSPAAHPAASAPAGHAAVKRDIAAPAAPSCRIVVVDDDQGARTGLGLLLEAWGASVQAFASIAALARWLQEPGVCAPDLLILDYHLPRPGDGLEALRLVRQAWPARPVPALLITGDERAAVANALSDGSLACLIKPVSPAPLLAAVRRQLGAQFGV
jgi:CheY-like chemotaxis protein